MTRAHKDEDERDGDHHGQGPSDTTAGGSNTAQPLQNKARELTAGPLAQALKVVLCSLCLPLISSQTHGCHQGLRIACSMQVGSRTVLTVGLRLGPPALSFVL